MADRVAQLIWTGDSRSAVKAVEQIAKANKTTTRQVKTDADEQAASFDKVKESSERLKGALGGLMGMIGIGGVAFGLKDLIEGGQALQTNQAQLRQSLAATGQAAAGTQARLQAMAESMSTRGGFATTQNLAALAAFVRETHSATEAQSMLSLATNIARGRNMDLASAQQIVQKAYTGSVGKLQALLGPMVAAREAQVGLTQSHTQEIARLQDQAQLMGKMGPIWLRQQEINDHITAQQTALAQMTDKHSTALQVLAAAQQEFGGATAAFSNTTAGKISNLKNSFQNLTESLGQALLPAMDDVVGVAEKVAEWMSKNKTVVRDVALAVAGLTTAWGGMKIVQSLKGMVMDLGKAFGLVAGSEEAAGAAGVESAAASTAAWDAFMTATIVGLVLVGLVELIEHWKAVRRVAVDVWHGIETVAKEVWHWIEGNWPYLVGILTGPVGLAVVWISKHFDQVKVAVTGVWHFIESIATKIFDAITFPFRKAFDFVKGGFDDVKKAFHFLTHPFGLSLATGGKVPQHFAAGGKAPQHFAAAGKAPQHFAAGGGPTGTDTIPAWLSPGEGVVTTQGMQTVGGEQGLTMINSGQSGALGGVGGGNVTINGSPVTFNVDGRQLGEAVVRWALSRAARGPTSYVGGSLTTGAAGIPS